ncbi:mediator of RNA polymerase II transcription subunit 15 [Eupeodes corollae]|uniref:mediator of RNA polymerase II transcription subunit 15 n=1 Tax=Eupeodes corollae TaxID=290404 RepID=UPI0024926B55|nr:mediator of RNA polymerase II transcription subunit 15 [Eupeodes corollae]
MAPKLSLLVLMTCAVAVCNAEAPFRGYSSRLQQQQAGPYPASGFRPDRTFNLPTGEAIAQQLRLAQIKKLQQQYQQQQQQIQQQQQQTPSQYYGTPSESEGSQSQFPQQPSGLYGAPQEEASNLQPSDFTRPVQQPSQQYGAPEETSASQLQGQFLRPQQATSQRQIQFQRQQQPSRQYGAPINKAIPESSSSESLEESKDVENVAPLDKKSGRITQGNKERDTENDEAETATNVAATTAAIPAGFVLVPISAAPAGFTPQKLALFPAQAAQPQAAFAKIQYQPSLIGLGLQQQKLLATPQLLAQQSYYQPQQFAFAASLQQAW